MKGICASVCTLALASLLAVPVVAQQRNPRLVATEPGRFTVGICNLRPAGKVNDGLKELRKGIEEREAPKRAEALTKAEAALLQALAATPRDPAGWYYLGRTYLAQGDVAGADSSFTHAVGLFPDCEIDVDQYRQDTWAALANAGIQARQEGDDATAMALFRDANTIFRGLPHVMESLGVLYANAGQTDSATLYLQRAVDIASADTSLTDNRNSAALNLSLVQQRAGRHDDALRILRQYLVWNPDDLEAKRSVAYSFRELGMADSADVIEQDLVSTFSSMNLDSLDLTDLMAVGVSQFNSDSYQEAARIFEIARARNPWNRDAVYNAANTYLAMENHEHLVSAGRRLLEIEPLNEDAYRLIGQGYRGLGRQDSLIKVVERLVTMPVNVEVTLFTVRTNGARWMATATGRAATDAGGTPIPPAPINVTLEFIDEQGTLLKAEAVAIPALAPGTSHELRVDASTEGVASWRYRRMP